MAGSPINEIMQMRKQGLSNNQVIQNLQREGYTNTQIFDAMNQADTKMAVEGVTPAGNIMGKCIKSGHTPDLYVKHKKTMLLDNSGLCKIFLVFFRH